MATFKFGIFYFLDKTVRVELTDIVKPNYKDKLVQVTSRPDLSSEEGWLEVSWSNRKAPQKKLAAKVLLLGDVYKDLVDKKNAFLKNEDIWIKKKRSEMKKKTPPQSQESRPKVQKKKLTKEATAKVLVDLKSVLVKKKPRTSTPNQSDDDDETDIDTNVDLFDLSPSSQRNMQHPNMANKAYEVAEGDISFSEAAGTSTEKRDMSGMESDDESLLVGQRKKMLKLDIDEEVVKALNELPGLVRSLKEVLETFKRMPPANTNPANAPLPDPTPEMITLANSEVQVTKRSFQRLSRTRMSLFAQELAVLIFGRDVLSTSSLTGRAPQNGTPKDQLDPVKLNALIDTVMAEFPGTTVSEIRAIIRRKCNNESFVLKKSQ